MPRLIIAIDGPSGAGKGTVARAVASRLGYHHVDTGAMYRAVAWKALRDGVDLRDESAMASLAARSRINASDDVVVIDGNDVRQAIRTPEIDRAATATARLPAVREVLVARQRAIGAQGGIVMEGRDVGTVVFPQAHVKIYLDATAEERARRRASDPAHTGGREGTLAAVANDLKARDTSDMTRTASPLAQAADAIRIDTTGLTIGEVVEKVIGVIQEKQRAMGNEQ